MLFFAGIASLIGYVYWFNNFRPSRITSDEALAIAQNYLDDQAGEYNYSQPSQSYMGPNPFFYHTWDVWCKSRTGNVVVITIDAHDGKILMVGTPIIDYA